MKHTSSLGSDSLSWINSHINDAVKGLPLLQIFNRQRFFFVLAYGSHNKKPSASCLLEKGLIIRKSRHETSWRLTWSKRFFFSNFIACVWEGSERDFRSRDGEGRERLHGRYCLCRFSLPPENCKNPDWSDWSIAALIPWSDWLKSISHYLSSLRGGRSKGKGWVSRKIQVERSESSEPGEGYSFSYEFPS